MKVCAIHYKGIEFVRFHELPADQQQFLHHNAALEQIKILMDGKVCSDCIQYKDYSDWHDAVFLKSIPVPDQLREPVRLSVAIVGEV